MFRFASTVRVRKLIVAIAFLATCIACSPMLHAQEDLEEKIPRPATELLLPETTVAFFQIPDFRDTLAKWQEGASGEFFRDENIAPLVERAIDEGRQAYTKIEEDVGLSIDEISSLPGGEMTIAVIAPRRKSPVFMVIFEVDEENEAVDKALDRVRNLAAENGDEFEELEKESGITYETITIDEQKVLTAQKDGLIISCTDEKVLDEFFMRWMGEEVKKVRPLAENRKFITIMNRCASKKELQPEVRFFVDPIGIFKSASYGNVGMAAAKAFLPTLGLDGLLGAGGSMYFADEDFEFVARAHLLLASPRKGIMEMISLKPAYYEPEPWMPANTHNYVTTSWDVDQMYAELTKMVDLFTEEGNFEKLVEDNVNENIGLNLRDDILSLFNGRVTFANATVEPIVLNSAGNIVGLGLKDPERAEEVIEALLEKFREEDEEFAEDFAKDEVLTEYNGIKYWSNSKGRMEDEQDKMNARRAERAERRGEEAEIRGEIRFPDPCIAIMSDCLIITDSRQLMENAIDVNTGSKLALRDNEDYQEMSTKMTNLLGSDMPCAVSYQQPEHQIEMWFKFLQTQNTKDFINSRAEQENEFFTIVQSMMEDHPLPEFEKIKKYLRPNGWFMTSDDTGYHMLWFQEKLKLEKSDE